MHSTSNLMFLHQSEIIEYKATNIVPQPIKLFVLTTKKNYKKRKKRKRPQK